jgi:glyoxylase-like metal-dependent hydrolase (beta-lactamase superfamily II)
MAAALQTVSGSFRGWGGAVDVTRPLAPGSELALRDRTLRVLHRPGHSPSDTVFVDESTGLMLAGDHLIAHISSNPILNRPLGRDDIEDIERPQSLLIYLESLRQTQEMELELVLSGHGVPVTEHAALIAERFRAHDRRAEKMFRSLADGPRTAHEIALDLWGNIAVTQAYLTLSEVVGHMDLLIRDGRVREVSRDDGTAVFEGI